jgi:hypothetical protein
MFRSAEALHRRLFLFAHNSQFMCSLRSSFAEEPLPAPPFNDRLYLCDQLGMRREVGLRHDDDLSPRDVLGLQPSALQRLLDGLLCLDFARVIAACASLARRATCYTLGIVSIMVLLPWLGLEQARRFAASRPLVHSNKHQHSYRVFVRCASMFCCSPRFVVSC